MLICGKFLVFCAYLQVAYYVFCIPPMHPNRSMAQALPPTDWSSSVSATCTGLILAALYIKNFEAILRELLQR